MRGSGVGGFGMVRWAAMIGVLVLAGCNADQKYHLAPHDPTLTYPKFLPEAPKPPEPVLSVAQQKANTAALERTRGNTNRIQPAHINPQ